MATNRRLICIIFPFSSHIGRKTADAISYINYTARDLRAGPQRRKRQAMIRFFDIADHDRLPWRFQRALHSLRARG